jgi:putative membrane protein
VGLVSIYPTLMFRRLGRAAKLGQQPAMTGVSVRNVRRVVHVQLAGVVLILLCAAMMARGVGVFG